MPGAPAGEPMGLGWLLVAIVAGALCASHVLATGLAVAFGPRGLYLVLFPGGALASWWFHRGAWLRTRWGRPAAADGAPWQEPPLTSRRAGWYIRLAIASVVCTAVALAIQATR